ncbi:MAG: inverse autotransporter beta domain-containing protein [Gammaproteobacteria bacterium]
MKKLMIFTLAAMAGFVVQNGAAEGGGGFADFYQKEQVRLFSAIDNTLATQAEKAIGDNFAAVRKVNVDFQSSIGGRKGNVGINLIGAFADADDYAFGWQLRAYGGQDIDGGANAGVFYRRTNGELLFGGNVFADYEKHEYGDFVRYSVGGELEHSIFSLAANYYAPITDDKTVNITVGAFSREGYDAKLRINAPRFRALKAAVDYYHFDGKNDTKAEDGFRYGMQWHPTPALRFNVFYDDGAEKIGGGIAYAWTFGETQARHNNNGETFAPDMFAAVSREYSQRIVTVKAGPGVSLSIRVVGIMTTAMTMPPVTTTTGMETMAAVTTRTAMTVAPVTTRTTMTMHMVTPSRLASVEITVRAAAGIIITTFGRSRALVTLPPAPITRPLVMTITTNNGSSFADGRVIISEGILAGFFAVGAAYTFPSLGLNTSTVTVVQGGEERIGSPTVTTLTTGTTTMTAAAVSTTTTMTAAAISTTMTMTMAAVSTTIRTTTFSTMFITLTANSAMGDIPPPLDSRLRGNDDIKARYSRKSGNLLLL